MKIVILALCCVAVGAVGGYTLADRKDASHERSKNHNEQALVINSNQIEDTSSRSVAISDEVDTSDRKALPDAVIEQLEFAALDENGHLSSAFETIYGLSAKDIDQANALVETFQRKVIEIEASKIELVQSEGAISVLEVAPYNNEIADIKNEVELEMKALLGPASKRLLGSLGTDVGTIFQRFKIDTSTEGKIAIEHQLLDKIDGRDFMRSSSNQEFESVPDKYAHLFDVEDAL